MKVKKIPDFTSWKKIGTMKTPLGREFLLYESPDESRIAQVNPDLVIQMIIEDGEAIYINPDIVDKLGRMRFLQNYLKKMSEKPEL
jgi:hypothetical protein